MYRKKERSWSIGLDATQLQNSRVLPASDFGHLKVTEPGYLKGRYANQVRSMRDKQMRYFPLIIPGETAKRRKKTKKRTIGCIAAKETIGCIA